MDVRRHFAAAFLAVLLTGCGSSAPEGAAGPSSESPTASEPASPTPSAVAESPTPSRFTDDAEGDFLDTNDVDSHFACLKWSHDATTDLVGPVGMSVAALALRSTDPAIVATATDLSSGPIIVDPWELTRRCKAHGYVVSPGSLAEAHDIDG